ncbi:MAG TPA: hypothetical protein VL461_13275 [Dictyobacter sp.]|jgi:hypothetical protein|nr:hypothetical protein [Dictyobacter sp.]
MFMFLITFLTIFLVLLGAVIVHLILKPRRSQKDRVAEAKLDDMLFL